MTPTPRATIDALRAIAGSSKTTDDEMEFLHSAADLLATVAAERDAAVGALKPFVGDKLPSLRRTKRDYDENGLRRMMSPMEIAVKNARAAAQASAAQDEGE